MENPNILHKFNVVLKRFDKTITPFHFLANVLHPKYQGIRLKDEQTESAFKFLSENFPLFVTDYISFTAKSAPFPQSLFSPESLKISAVIWWKSLKRYKLVNQQFVNFAICVLSCPASSAAIERIFSSFGNVHTKARNRLGVERASKLVFCYRLLRGSTSDDE